MADIGLKSGKVRAGFYRCGPYYIHKGQYHWGVYLREKFVVSFRTLSSAYAWARQNPPAADAATLEQAMQIITILAVTPPDAWGSKKEIHAVLNEFKLSASTNVETKS